jgi:hypothetical protein
MQEKTSPKREQREKERADALRHNLRKRKEFIKDQQKEPHEHPRKNDNRPQ